MGLAAPDGDLALIDHIELEPRYAQAVGALRGCGEQDDVGASVSERRDDLAPLVPVTAGVALIDEHQDRQAGAVYLGLHPGGEVVQVLLD